MTVNDDAPTLLDQFTPHFDFALREHVLITCEPGRAAQLVSRFSAGPPRLFGCALGVPMRPRVSTPGFDELLANGRWSVLGHRPGEGVVLGAAGRFWTTYADWQDIAPADFASYNRPRRATIAVAISHAPGTAGTLLTFEARATTTDPIAYRWADWYWHTIRPTARLVIRQVLRQAGN
ncbi:MAG TPA: hypothetical protein VHC18_25095 [Amycolatopsis sp.]|nr:hypothetical protein [Amycolatopsis sp.]